MLVAGTAMLCLPMPALAQDGGEVVVTGRGLDHATADRAYDVVELDRATIEASASNRLEDVLRAAAGLQQFRRSDSRSANPTSQGITLRGLGGNASSRALLILDGVPQSDPFGGWVAFPAYSTGRLGAIRVVRGGGSGLYGPGALAGIVELESAAPGDLAPLDLDVAYGSRAGVEASGSAALIRGSGFATVSAAYARGDGFVPIVAGQRGAADRAAPYESASGAVRGVVAIGASTELQANLNAFTDHRDRGLAFTENASEGADASIRLVGHGDWRWAALAYVQTRNFASRFASIDAARSATTLTLDQYGVPSTGLGARVEVSPPVGAGATLRIGADTRTVSGETRELYTYVAGQPTRRRVGGGMARTYGLFADGSIALGSVTLSGDARIDAWRIVNGHLVERPLVGGPALTDTHFADRDGQEVTGRVGIAWRPVAALTLRAAAYRGWRLPALNELYRPFRVGADATAANALLAPERLTGVDLGFDWRPAGGVSLSATAYDNRLDGAIANVTVARGPGTFPGVGFVSAAGFYRVRQNLDAVRARGVEVDGVATMGAVTARLSYAYADARVVAGGTAAALDGLRPAQTPLHQASATLGWANAAGAGASLTARHVAPQFEDDLNGRALAAATTFDARLALPLGAALTLEARAENLADARVEAAIGADGTVERAAPRTLWIGARLRIR